jgi:predicted transcriptional regulator YheO
MKATIKTKTGAVITVEGSQNEVNDVLAHLELTASVHKAQETKKAHTKSIRETHKRAGASDLVIALKDEGFFKKARTLGEIADALQEKGFLVPTTSLSGVVLGLVQKRYLGRKKNDGKWVYGN